MSLVDEARALADAIKRKRQECSFASVGYGKLEPAAYELELVSEDAERVLALLADQIESTANQRSKE